MSESSETRLLCQALARFNCTTAAITGSQFMRNWPDRYVHHSRWAGWIEFKIGCRKCTPAQKEIIKKLNRSRPGSAFVCRHTGSCTGRIEDQDGNLLATYEGPQPLLLRLQELTQEMNQ